jgi:hypothetical protein
MNTTPTTLDEFNNWVLESHGATFDAMDAPTGATYRAHLDSFTRTNAALTLLVQFKAAHPTSPSAISADAGEAAYTRHDATQGARDISQAIAIMRAVQVAVGAVDDGSMVYEFAHVSRWGPAVGAATKRVSRVRDGLFEKAGAPFFDWFTPLTLLEALDAALWHGPQCEGLQMDSSQVMSMAQAVIDELEEMAQAFTELSREASAGSQSKVGAA